MCISLSISIEHDSVPRRGEGGSRSAIRYAERGSAEAAAACRPPPRRDASIAACLAARSAGEAAAKGLGSHGRCRCRKSDGDGKRPSFLLTKRDGNGRAIFCAQWLRPMARPCVALLKVSGRKHAPAIFDPPMTNFNPSYVLFLKNGARVSHAKESIRSYMCNLLFVKDGR